jgi:hypothetical protein
MSETRRQLSCYPFPIRDFVESDGMCVNKILGAFTCQAHFGAADERIWEKTVHRTVLKLSYAST